VCDELAVLVRGLPGVEEQVDVGLVVIVARPYDVLTPDATVVGEERGPRARGGRRAARGDLRMPARYHDRTGVHCRDQACEIVPGMRDEDDIGFGGGGCVPHDPQD
jgi:hypothetical protein